MKKLCFLLSLMGAILFSSSGIFAAEVVDLSKENIQVTFDVTSRSLTPQDQFAKALKLDDGEDLTLINEVKSLSGKTHYRFQQTHQGMPIFGYHVLGTTDPAGGFINLRGKKIRGIKQDLRNVATIYRSEDIEKKIHQQFLLGETVKRGDTFNISNSTARKMVYIDIYGKARPAIGVSFFADTVNGGSPKRPFYMVDATSMEILLEFDNLQHENATGPGGNVKIGKYEYGKEFPALNVKKDITVNPNYAIMENENVLTIDLNQGSVGFPFTFRLPRNTHKEVNGAYSPLNDAHFMGGVVFDMYKDWFNSAPLTFKLEMRVHYSVNYDNAFWDGTGMTFGDGFQLFYPLVCLDVVSHEVSHGFTEQNSALIYTRQSGGLNEAFSDMAGKAAEYYLHGKNPWTLGGDIMKNGDGLRFMDDPPKDKKSIGHANDYHDAMNVHYSSGVYNKVFYLLSTTPGWNTKKAFEVFTLANQAYWQPGASFKSAGIGAVLAAEELDYEDDDVEDALEAVGIDIESPNLPPVPPVVKETLVQGRSAIKVTWNPGTLVDYYSVYYKRSQDVEFIKAGETKGYGFTVNGLSPLTGYDIKLSATNIYGVSNFSETTSATTIETGDLPQTPINFKSSLLKGFTYAFSWDPVASATGYKAYYSWRKDGNYILLASLPGTKFSLPLPMDATLYFKVLAFNKTGESDLTAPLAVTTAPCDDPVIHFTADTQVIQKGDKVTLTWDIKNSAKVRARGAWGPKLTMQGTWTSRPIDQDSVFVIEAVNECGTMQDALLTIKVAR